VGVDGKEFTLNFMRGLKLQTLKENLRVDLARASHKAYRAILRQRVTLK
jgi:hypothetical protein